ncbi:MAG: Ig-like domain-containing protein [Bacillota bacterium]|nr:Ig-like domain-containing protein [Bacillota bacterium]
MNTYNVYRNGQKIKDGLTEKNYTDIGLEPNTEYSYQVSAVNDKGESPLSTAIPGTTQSIEVTGINLNKTSTSIAVGANETLTATILPENATDKEVLWSSSDESKGTVDSTGKVIGIAEGTVTITAKAHGDQTKTASCEVTVTAA